MKSAHNVWWRVMVLLISLSLILAACGGGNQPATESPAASPDVAASPSPGGAEVSPAASPEASPAESPASPAAPAADGEAPLNPDVAGNIELWHFWGSPLRRNAIRRVIATCQQKLPNIQVTETFKPFGDIWTANIAAVAAGSGMPDVIVEDRPLLKQRAADGIATNLGELARRDGIDGSYFWPFTWEQSVYEGDPYGLPYETDVRVLYWNKNAFREAGLDPERPPTTWDELEQIADQLDRMEGGTIQRMAFSPLIGNVGPDVWVLTNGHELISPEGEPQINDPAMVETMEWIKGWIDRYGGWQNHQNFRANFASPPNDAFMSGQVVMYVDTNGYNGVLNFFRPQYTKEDGSRENLEWGVTDIPYKVQKGSTSGGFSLSIPQGAANVEPAWEWIKCATGKDAQISWARDTNSMPGNQIAAQDPILLADPNWQFFVNAMEYSSGGTYLPAYPNWKQELDQRYEQVWTGQLSAQEALDQAQQAVEAEIGR